ncbi:ATP-binding protein [Piscinibacter sp. XHJ-5]|uniref:ATP-binding protein n=1 Tax=Piscinibacter sp. XHJ-5 TaxID=3037797 RepID=UPI0024534A5B|nr:ATP-binding protein [Piscinibacter sp. XHJ-5]
MKSNMPSHVDPRHPVIRQEYGIFTPPVHAMAQTIGDWIDQRQPGGYIYGPSRFGKSNGVRWHVRSILEDRFGRKIPLHIWSRPYDPQPTEGQFWQSVGLAFGHRYAKSRATRADRRQSLKEFLIASAERSGGNYVVIVIDEAQEMTYREWQWLLSLQNALDMDGYRMSVFSIASHQMGYTYELLGRAEQAHVAARFMVAHWPFPGICGLDEVEYALRGYDELSEWPEGSGTSFLAHFAPEAFAQGARLSPWSVTVWRVLDALLPPHYEGEVSFPMQHLVRSVEELLMRAARGAPWEEVTAEPSWLEVIAQTGFTDHMRLISASMPKRRGGRRASELRR